MKRLTLAVSVFAMLASFVVTTLLIHARADVPESYRAHDAHIAAVDAEIAAAKAERAKRCEHFRWRLLDMGRMAELERRTEDSDPSVRVRALLSLREHREAVNVRAQLRCTQ